MGTSYIYITLWYLVICAQVLHVQNTLENQYTYTVVFRDKWSPACPLKNLVRRPSLDDSYPYGIIIGETKIISSAFGFTRPSNMGDWLTIHPVNTENIVAASISSYCDPLWHIKKIILHPEYDFFRNDIAVVIMRNFKGIFLKYFSILNLKDFQEMPVFDSTTLCCMVRMFIEYNEQRKQYKEAISLEVEMEISSMENCSASHNRNMTRFICINKNKRSVTHNLMRGSPLFCVKKQSPDTRILAAILTDMTGYPTLSGHNSQEQKSIRTGPSNFFNRRQGSKLRTRGNGSIIFTELYSYFDWINKTNNGVTWNLNYGILFFVFHYCFWFM